MATRFIRRRRRDSESGAELVEFSLVFMTLMMVVLEVLNQRYPRGCAGRGATGVHADRCSEPGNELRCSGWRSDFRWKPCGHRDGDHDPRAWRDETGHNRHRGV